jgi:hypothetical protein
MRTNPIACFASPWGGRVGPEPFHAHYIHSQSSFVRWKSCPCYLFSLSSGQLRITDLLSAKS